MSTGSVSPIACLFLLPVAYVYAGSCRALWKEMASGPSFFHEVLAGRRRVGTICAALPGWKAALILFFFFTASYLHKHGGLYYGSTNCFMKMRKLGLRGILFSARAEMHNIIIKQDDSQQRVLLYVDSGAHETGFLISFLQCLKTSSYTIDFFAEQNSFFVKNAHLIKKAGAKRVVARSDKVTIMDYCHEVGDSYSVYLIRPGGLSHAVLDTMRYVSPHATILCICEDSAEILGVEPSLLEKIDHIICHKITCSPENIQLVQAPELRSDAENFQFDKLFYFFGHCEILPLGLAVRYYAQYPLGEKAPGEPVVSLAIQLDEDITVTRGMVGALLAECCRAQLACEIVFWGKILPPWVSELAVPWQYIDISPEISLSHLERIDEKCSCEYVLLVQAGTLLLRGLRSALSILKRSSAVHLCGSRLLAPNNTLYEVGALLKGGSIYRIGYGESLKAPFFKVNRSVPLLSLKLLLFRKGIGLFSPDRQDIQFFNEDGGYIGFAEGASLAVICADLTACLSRVETGLTQRERTRITDEAATALAMQDRYVPHSEAGTERPVRILYYSPYQSHPASHGNRSTIQFFGKIFREKGCEVHFALLGLDRYAPEDIAAMRASWDSLTILPYPFHDDSHLGVDVLYDGWYEKGLGEHIAYLCSLYSIDMLFCSYVFQSKMLEFVPGRIVKVIDTHDKMGGRYAAQKARGVKTEFFSCTPEDEGRYLRRADIVIARREEEAVYFNEVSGRDSAIVIPHVEPPHFLERRFERLRSVGLVASANKINLDLLIDFLCAIWSKKVDVPFMVTVAGQVDTMLKDVPPDMRAVFQQPWVKMLGFVEDIAEFYDSVDLVVSPVTLGTGINVKTVQAMSYGMPLVTTTCGCKGIETGHPIHSYTTVQEVVDCVFELYSTPQRLEELAACSRQRYKTFYEDGLKAFDYLLNKCRKKTVL